MGVMEDPPDAWWCQEKNADLQEGLEEVREVPGEPRLQEILDQIPNHAKVVLNMKRTAKKAGIHAASSSPFKKIVRRSMMAWRLKMMKLGMSVKI